MTLEPRDALDRTRSAWDAKLAESGMASLPAHSGFLVSIIARLLAQRQGAKVTRPWFTATATASGTECAPSFGSKLLT